jgi:hypothetical protein
MATEMPLIIFDSISTFCLTTKDRVKNCYKIASRLLV